MRHAIVHVVRYTLVVAGLCVTFGGTENVLLSSAEAQNRIFWSEAGGLWRASPGASARERVAIGFEVRGIALADGSLVWSDVEPRVPITPTGVIRIANADGRGTRDVATELPSPSGVAVHSHSQTVYWSDLELNAIYRRPLDGSLPPEQILGNMAGIASIHSIFLEEDQRKLYFGFVNPLIDSLVPGAIARVNLDGSELEILVSRQTEPIGVAVDPVEDMIYWTDVPFIGTGVVRRAPASGGEAEDLVDGLAFPQGIALDVPAGHLYFADAGTGKIQGANLDGSGLVDVLANLPQPRAVALQLVPEPATLALTAFGLFGLIGLEAARATCRRMA